jgi:hypothetical protein
VFPIFYSVNYPTKAREKNEEKFEIDDRECYIYCVRGNCYVNERDYGGY